MELKLQLAITTRVPWADIALQILSCIICTTYMYVFEGT